MAEGPGAPGRRCGHLMLVTLQATTGVPFFNTGSRGTKGRCMCARDGSIYIGPYRNFINLHDHILNMSKLGMSSVTAQKGAVTPTLCHPLNCGQGSPHPVAIHTQRSRDASDIIHPLLHFLIQEKTFIKFQSSDFA